MPCAHVARLFLAPHQFGALESSKLLDQRLQRHRIELLDPHQINIVDAALLALVVEIVIDLARAEHDPANLAIGHQLDLFLRQHHSVIVEDAMERGVGAELLQPRDRALVTQQGFRRHQDQGLANLSM